MAFVAPRHSSLVTSPPVVPGGQALDEVRRECLQREDGTEQGSRVKRRHGTADASEDAPSNVLRRLDQAVGLVGVAGTIGRCVEEPGPGGDRQHLGHGYAMAPRLEPERLCEAV